MQKKKLICVSQEKKDFVRKISFHFLKFVSDEKSEECSNQQVQLIYTKLNLQKLVIKKQRPMAATRYIRVEISTSKPYHECNNQQASA